MQIQSAKKHQNPAPFSPNGNRYHGPTDGKSRPAKKLATKVSSAVLGLAYKLDLQGEENLPKSGSHVYAANHPGYFDPLVMSRVAGDRDLRFMAAMENFKTPLGAKVNEWAGAFPVDRKNPHPQTMKHAEELFSEGASLGIFPEGRGPDQIGVLGPIKPGAALFAIRGEADSVVPMAFHYVEAPEATLGSKARSLLKSALAAAGAAVGGALAGPVLLAGLAGSVAGSALGAKSLRKFLKNPNVRTPFPKLIGGAVGGLLGAGAGGVGLVAATASLPLGAATVAVGAAAGLGTYLWDQWGQNRDRVEVLVEKPLSLSDYSLDQGERKAVDALTGDLHRSIGGALEKLTGVPYVPLDLRRNFTEVK